MKRAFEIVKLACESIMLLTVAACAVYFTLDQHKTEIEARSEIRAASDATQGLVTTLAAINAPCTGFHGSVTCGPIAQLSQTEKNVGILVGQTTLQVKQSAAIIQTSAKALTDASSDLHGVATALVGTANSATTTVQKAGTAIASLQPVLEALKKDAEQLQATEIQLTALIQMAQPVVKNAAVVSGNMGDMTTDAKTKFHLFLYPDPCKSKWCRVRRIWPYIHGGMEMTEPAYWGYQIFKNAKP